MKVRNETNTGRVLWDGDRVIWIEDRMSKKCRYDRSEIDAGCDGCGKRLIGVSDDYT